MKPADFNYNLPAGLIAQTPMPTRDKSKLMVLNRDSGQMEHKIFKDIIFYLQENDVLVINDTKVIPARLYGMKEPGGAKIELLLLKKIEEPEIWEALLNPGRRVKIGSKIFFAKELTAEVLAKKPDGKAIVKFSCKGNFRKIIGKIGRMPLPPYIKRPAGEEDKKRYQTVFARKEGAVAAPTAGLHFTPSLLAKIKTRGVKIAPVTLHTGWGTFQPVRVENITEHKMEEEYFQISAESAQLINEAKKKGGRIIAVGTTSVRTLESAAEKIADGWKLKAGSGWTNLFVYPGYKFKLVDALVTNFHLPESTLLMLVSAFAGKELIDKTYQEAIRKKYRFFSYGDAMLIK
ncbi:MAG: tRNA preQ1(34) S-adenosylmethionine ribosyltransferase-isomerase QueA [bacterium]